MEIWKDIQGFEGLYQVSSIGRLRSLNRSVSYNNQWQQNLKEKIISQRVGTRGYSQSMLSKNNIRTYVLLHRLVAIAFLNRPEGKNYINHKNGIKSDNRIENLEWCTQSENVIHAIKVLGKQYGRHYDRLSTEEIVIITNSPLPPRELSKLIGRAHSTISICRRKERLKQILENVEKL